MDLSVVLWNCNGQSKKGFTKYRRDSCESTIKSWIEKQEVPTVVLAQELKGSIRKTWERLSHSSVNCDTACLFPKTPDAPKLDIEFLDSAYLTATMDARKIDDVETARIQCSIMKIGSDKILICSWHGLSSNVNVDKKQQLLEKMLELVDCIKEKKECCVALVGGDYNLESCKATNAGSISEFLESRDGILHDTYAKPSYRRTLIDYVIYWPSDRVLQNGTSVIDTLPKQPEEKESRMFDHALIQYNFRVLLEGKWEGEGEMTCIGSNCGEVKLNDKSEFVMSGEYEGQDFDGDCEGLIRLEISGRHLDVKCGRNGEWFRVNKNVTIHTIETNVSWQGSGTVKLKSKRGGVTVGWWSSCKGGEEVKWNGKGEATWIGGQLVQWKGNQTVKWAGDQTVKWAGGGKVDFQEGSVQPQTVEGKWTWKLIGSVVNWNADEGNSNKLEWKGKGVAWKVVGNGSGIAKIVE